MYYWCSAIGNIILICVWLCDQFSIIRYVRVLVLIAAIVAQRNSFCSLLSILTLICLVFFIHYCMYSAPEGAPCCLWKKMPSVRWWGRNPRRWQCPVRAAWFDQLCSWSRCIVINDVEPVSVLIAYMGRGLATPILECHLPCRMRIKFIEPHLLPSNQHHQMSGYQFSCPASSVIAKF